MLSCLSPLSASLDATGATCYPNRMTPFADTPDRFSHAELQRFEHLVIKGGEVGGNVLTANIRAARVLVVYREKGVIQGVSALKRPKESYREKVEAKSGVPLRQSDFPYELSYIFLEAGLRKRGLSYPLVAATLDPADGAGVFATVRTDNGRMRATLKRAGFRPVGEPWEGRENRIIGLLIRPAENSAT